MAEVTIKSKKIDVVEVFADGMQFQKSFGEEKLREFLKNNYGRFASRLLATINVQFDSITAQKADLLTEEKKKIISIHNLIESYLANTDRHRSNELFSRLSEQLDELLDLMKSE